MKIILVRHGETEENGNGVMQGSKINGHLNDRGIRETKKLKEKLRAMNIDICITSPMIRTWETAMILVGERVPIEEDKRLIQRCLGDYEGKEKVTYDHISYWNYQSNHHENGVEPIQDIFKRCNSFINDLKEKYFDQTVLIVTHGGIVRALYHILNKTDLNKNLYQFEIDNLFIKEFEI